MGSHVTAPGEQLGVRCLAQGHLSCGIEGGESTVHSLPPPTIPAGPEIRTHNPPLTSPTRYPLGHDCPTNLQYRQCLLDCTLYNAFALFIRFIYLFYYFLKAMYAQVIK